MHNYRDDKMVVAGLDSQAVVRNREKRKERSEVQPKRTNFNSELRR